MTRPISQRMLKNADKMTNIIKDLIKDESIMTCEFESAMKNRNAFIRSIELLRAPKVSASVLCHGHDLVQPKESSPERPSKRLKAEDTRMRLLAKEVVSTNKEVPLDLLWPYYQDALLDKNKGTLDHFQAQQAMKIMERDAGKANKFRKYFYW